MKKKKTELNLVNLRESLNGKKWGDLSKEEQLEISQQLVDKLFPKKKKMLNIISTIL